LFDRRFLSFCGFAIRSVARAAASLWFWFGRDTGTGFLSDAVDRWRKYSRAEASGASFASLRRAGLRLARLKPVFISVSHGRPEHLFLPPFRVAASCLFQSAAEPKNNSEFTIQNAQFVILRRSSTDEESDSLSFVIDS
jgi:hypothetical protein